MNVTSTQVADRLELRDRNAVKIDRADLVCRDPKCSTANTGKESELEHGVWACVLNRLRTPVVRLMHKSQLHTNVFCTVVRIPAIFSTQKLIDARGGWD